MGRLSVVMLCCCFFLHALRWLVGRGVKRKKRKRKETERQKMKGKERNKIGEKKNGLSSILEIVIDNLSLLYYY
jgi:hypothetical protein